MVKTQSIQLFEDRKVRTVWDSETEKWYISIVDVIEVLTDSANPRRYWSDLKRKLQAEGSQLYENIVQLKMKSSDGKNYNTDVADVEQLFRLIQSIPSPKMGNESTTDCSIFKLPAADGKMRNTDGLSVVI